VIPDMMVLPSKDEGELSNPHSRIYDSAEPERDHSPPHSSKFLAEAIESEGDLTGPFEPSSSKGTQHLKPMEN